MSCLAAKERIPASSNAFLYPKSGKIIQSARLWMRWIPRSIAGAQFKCHSVKSSVIRLSILTSPFLFFRVFGREKIGNWRVKMPSLLHNFSLNKLFIIRQSFFLKFLSFLKCFWSARPQECNNVSVCTRCDAYLRSKILRRIIKTHIDQFSHRNGNKGG